MIKNIIKFNVNKEIKDLKKELKDLKEKVRILECQQIGVDPYEPHSAYDLSRL
jgi:hypothetical protein